MGRITMLELPGTIPTGLIPLLPRGGVERR